MSSWAHCSEHEIDYIAQDGCPKCNETVGLKVRTETTTHLDWKCHYCGSFRPSKEYKCDVCGASRKEK
jgi:DNA-directed RNA polymerase subunit RPC12/RpoP